MVYFVVFLISIFFARLCEGAENRTLRLLFGSLSVLCPSLLAGLRDQGVGYDTYVYSDVAISEVYASRNDSIFAFISTLFDGDYTFEPLFIFLNYLGLSFSDSVTSVFLVCSLFIVGMAFKAMYDYRDKASLPLMMLVFLFLYFNISLNIMRQTIALVIALNVFIALEKKQWVWACVLMALLFGAHSTAFVFLLFFFLYYVYKFDKTQKIVLLVLFSILGGFTLFDILIELFINLNILPTKFVAYMASQGETAVFKTALLYGWLSWAMMMYSYRLILETDKRELTFITNVKLLANVLLLASMLNVWVFRMSYYMAIFDVLFVPRVIRLVVEGDNERRGRILGLVLILLIVFYWYWSIIHNNENETYPYKSAILGI